MKRINPPILISIVAFLFSCEKDSDPEPSIAIGDFHEGGVVFYVDETGEHGLVCAVSDQGSEIEWGCPSLLNFGAKGLEIGTGQQNTQDILNACNESNTAAALCDELEMNGYTDWFLPSRDELDSLYQHREIVQETALNNNGEYIQAAEYWSSSHYLDNTVWVQHFNAGNQSSALKDNKYVVRAIRAF
jgi:hypothetical protein